MDFFLDLLQLQLAVAIIFFAIGLVADATRYLKSREYGLWRVENSPMGNWSLSAA